MQVREKNIPTGDLIRLTRRIRYKVSHTTLIFVNSDAEAALEAEADGLHLPEGFPMPVDTGDLLVSRSVHSVKAARNAEDEGCDMLIVGTIFKTASHPESKIQGVKVIRDCIESISIPVIAIGGINISNIPEVMATGAAGVAVIGAILRHYDPYIAASALYKAMKR